MRGQGVDSQVSAPLVGEGQTVMLGLAAPDVPAVPRTTAAATAASIKTRSARSRERPDAKFVFNLAPFPNRAAGRLRRPPPEPGSFHGAVTGSRVRLSGPPPPPRRPHLVPAVLPVPHGAPRRGLTP